MNSSTKKRRLAEEAASQLQSSTSEDKISKLKVETMQETQPQEIGATPMVFSCRECRNIITDSWALESVNEELGTLSFRASDNILRSSESDYSKAGADFGCAYHEIFCSGCKVLLGRTYFSTSRIFDSLRDLYTFDVNKLGTYRLGMSRNLDGAAPIMTVSKDQGKAQVQVESNAERSLIIGQVEKLRRVSLVFHARLTALEVAVQGGSGGEMEGEGGSGHGCGGDTPLATGRGVKTRSTKSQSIGHHNKK